MANASSIEQQLDLKYKAYSTMNSQMPVTGAGPMPGQGKLGAAGGPNPGMLPNNSQFLYANNLRTSMEKPFSNGKCESYLSRSELTKLCVKTRRCN